jgi:hypothetical protein
MRRLLSASLFVALGCLGSVSAQDGKDALYFPVEVGAKRVFEKTQNGKVTGTMTSTVTKVERTGDVYVVHWESDPGGGKEFPTVYEISPKGIVRIMAGNQKEVPPFPLLKVGGKAGESWSGSFQGVPGTDPVKYTLKSLAEEEVEVPAGKFKAIPVVMEYEAMPGKAASITQWYAVGIGNVKVLSKGDGIDVNVVLKSFAPGK